MSSELTYKKHITAFIDILGFKQLIQDTGEDKDKLALMYKLLNFLKDREYNEFWNTRLVEIEEDAQKKELGNFEIVDKTNCTVFSDSIVVSVQADEHINEIVSTLITQLAYIGSELMKEGILIRGGITIGKLIHDTDGIVLGPGMIDAYEIESKLASYPRIILSDKLISKLNYPVTTKKDRFPYHQYLERFSDGCVGFHQMIYFEVLQNWKGLPKSKLREDLTKIKQTIITGLDYSFNNPSVYSKYKWLQIEYNKLAILGDGLKSNFHKLNEQLYGKNIHHSYTENAHDKS